jgi:hypothetical protein
VFLLAHLTVLRGPDEHSPVLKLVLPPRPWRGWLQSSRPVISTFLDSCYPSLLLQTPLETSSFSAMTTYTQVRHGARSASPEATSTDGGPSAILIIFPSSDPSHSWRTFVTSCW